MNTLTKQETKPHRTSISCK